ncbi:MAG: TldD/PmbA family protein [Candidatus Krumholzibacteria bacterium]|nr:TldD/PmbA family protein [Candidatus Krumholzibacteria bacterium]
MREIIDTVLQAALDAGCECEVYTETVERFSVDVYRGAVESVDRSRDAGAAVRICAGGRTGFAWTSDLGRAAVLAAVEAAVGSARQAGRCDFDVLADAGEGECPPGQVGPWPIDRLAGSKIEGALAMEAAALGADPRIANTESAGYSEFTAQVIVAGTRGFRRSERRGMCACAAGAVAGGSGEMRTGYYYSQAADPALLDFAAVGAEAARRAASLLGARPLPTGRYPVVFDGIAFAEIVSLLAECLSGEMAVRGTTVFAGSLGRAVAPPIFSLVDDPFLPGGCFNAGFDDEGAVRRRRMLIEGGVLREFLHTSRSAREAGGPALPGSAQRGSYRSLPCAGPTNLYVVPAAPGGADPVESLRDGLYIQDVMGAHTADPISGDFSVGIQGRRVSGGRLAEPVSGMTVSGTVTGLLSGIAMIGDRAKFSGPCGSPDVLVEGLSLGGR